MMVDQGVSKCGSWTQSPVAPANAHTGPGAQGCLDKPSCLAGCDSTGLRTPQEHRILKVLDQHFLALWPQVSYLNSISRDNWVKLAG